MRRVSRTAPAAVACALLIAIVSGCAMLGIETPDSLMKEGQQF
jgi:hypothetical protein